MQTRARDVMQTPVVRVSADDPLDGVEQLFSDEQIHGAPVVDERGEVIGVISTSDLLRAASDEREAARPSLGYFRDGERWSNTSYGDPQPGSLTNQRVADAMTLDIVAVDPETPVADVAGGLRTNRIHRVLVMDGNDLLGIISSFDLIALLEKRPVRAGS